MSTAQALRSQEKTGNWSAIFPNEQVTQQQSALFVKKLLAVAISNITYLRAIFPEHAFGDRCLEDLNLKILRDDTSCPGACQVIKWVKGCFDALDKKYLRMLVIGIYLDPEDQDTVIESYTFKFSYTEGGGIDIYRNDKKVSSAATAAETKKATIRLLRTIVVLTQTLKSLPDDVMMTMKLLYFDEVTPEDYEPPGFRPSDSDTFVFEEQPMNIKVGDVATPFHCVKMRIKTDSKQFELKSDAEEDAKIEDATDGKLEVENQDIDMKTDEMTTSTTLETENSGKKKEPALVPEHCEDIPLQSPAKPGQKTSKKPSGPEAEMEDDDELGVKCPCGCNEDDGLMILCSICKFWQHGVCFKIMEEEDAPENHICSDCSSVDNIGGEVTDPYLIGLSPIAIQATCLWRRALIACTDSTRVVAPTFSRRLGVEMTVAQGLLNRLEKEGFIKNPTKGKRLGKIVNKDKILSDGVKKYFKKQKSDKRKMEAESGSKRDCSLKKSELFEDPESTTTKEIDNLTEMTEGITLAGRKKKISSAERSNAKLNENKVHHSPRLRQNDLTDDKREQQTRGEKRRGKKRAIAKSDLASEFEVSNSQDVDYDRHSRKRKASVASRAIMV
ncbi:uncharacterized protein LOC135468143 [Liolophura sinensis]|uniref:uncharacterized protein LOC135468143 n=1 Tax=Liolophura sinensis TaxID=3198878 RepID=UPI0031584E33